MKPDITILSVHPTVKAASAILGEAIKAGWRPKKNRVEFSNVKLSGRFDLLKMADAAIKAWQKQTELLRKESA